MFQRIPKLSRAGCCLLRQAKTKVRRALLVATVCLLSTTVFAQENTIYKTAVKAFQEKQFETAAKLFDQTEKQAAAPEETSLFLAKCLIQMRQFAPAEAALTRYADKHPRVSDAAFLRGYVLFRENKPGLSLAAYTHAATLATPKADDLKIVALDYVLLNDDALAVHWLRRSVAFDPKDSEAWYFLGRSLFHQSQFSEAERAFEEALRLEPGSIRARNNLGISYEAENRPLEALAEYKRAVAEDRKQRVREQSPHLLPLPSSAQESTGDRVQPAAETEAQPYLNEGGLLLKQNQATAAVLVLREATDIAPECVACHQQLGQGLARSGAMAEARKELERAVQLRPSDPALHYELGLLYQRSGDATAAKAELMRSKELYGTRATDPTAR